MANTMKGMYIGCASGLNYGDLTKLKTTDPRRKEIITECADGYIQATKDGDDIKRSQYISALMLMFYGEISKMAEKCKAVKEYEYEDFASKLYECIDTACSYAAWKDGKHTAEACIRSCIASRGAAAILYESNLDKSKLNYNTCSLDAVIDNDSDTTSLDLIEDESANRYRSDMAARLIIQNVINKGDLISGIILDNIAFSDSQKEIKVTKTATDCETGEEFKYQVGRTEFSERSLIKSLTNLPDDYKEYFLSQYDVNDDAISAAINRIKSVNNNKLYTFVRTTLASQKALVNC